MSATWRAGYLPSDDAGRAEVERMDEEVQEKPASVAAPEQDPEGPDCRVLNGPPKVLVPAEPGAQDAEQRQMCRREGHARLRGARQTSLFSVLYVFYAHVPS